MKIQNTGSEILRSATYTRGVRGGGTEAVGGPAATQSSTSAGRSSDQVQISEAGRALAARASTSTDGTRAELSPERVAVIRQKILEGAYNSVGVVDEVARRMLERGDI